MSERQVEEGQVWAFREDEHSQYSEYLLVDAVWDDRFSYQAGYIKYIRPVTFLLDNPKWELLDAEKICELLYKQREYIRIIHESAELERQLISARDFAEQEVKEKERICESMQARLMQVAEELDETIGSYRKQLADANESINKMREQFSRVLSENKKLKDSISCAADEQEGIFVFLKDGSERLIKGGVRHAFDNIHDMFYVMNKEDETIAGFESDFVRGFMPVNRRQQRCD